MKIDIEKLNAIEAEAQAIKTQIREAKEVYVFAADRLCDLITQIQALEKQAEEHKTKDAATFPTHLERCHRCEAGQPRLFNVNYTGFSATALYYCPKCGGQYEKRRFCEFEEA